MTSGMLDNLKISEEKKKYIAEKLNPVLEEMVTECLSALPGNPVDFMVEYLSKKNGVSGGGSEEDRKKNEELKKQVADMQQKVNDAGKMMAATGGEEEEEEEEEEDDDVDEIPESFQKPAGQMKTARASVSAEAYGAWNQKAEFTPPVIPKSDEQ